MNFVSHRNNLLSLLAPTQAWRILKGGNSTTGFALVRAVERAENSELSEEMPIRTQMKTLKATPRSCVSRTMQALLFWLTVLILRKDSFYFGVGLTCPLEFGLEHPYVQYFTEKTTWRKSSVVPPHTRDQAF